VGEAELGKINIQGMQRLQRTLALKNLKKEKK
jgi:hypothetical protein